MKNVMLINLASKDCRSNSFPLGLSYIAAALNFCNVEIVDLNYVDSDELIQKVSNKHFDVVGISCYTGNFIEASSLAKTIKEIDGKSLMVIGGYHATSEYEYIIGNHNEFDIAIRGRGEIPFTELICALSNNQDLNEVHSIAYRRNGNVIVRASTKTVTGNYLPDRKNENKYFLSSGKEKISCIATMRGCYFNCSFCSINSNEWTSVCSKEFIKKDIENIVKNGGDSLYFVNPDFLCNRKCLENTLAIIEEYKEIKTFKISTRSDSILKNLDILETLFALGCNSIEVGIESFSDSQLGRYNKHLTADENIKSYKAIMNFYDKYHFRYIHELIPFDPWVTRDELIDTVGFYSKNKFDYLELEPWLFTKLILYPNTVLRSKAEKESIISGNSHIEIPFWNFINDDVAMVYSALMKYKTNLLPKLNIVRDNMQFIIKSDEATSVQKIVCLKIKEKLSRITVDYFMDLLIHPISEYEKILNEKINVVEHYLKNKRFC